MNEIKVAMLTPSPRRDADGKKIKAKLLTQEEYNALEQTDKDRVIPYAQVSHFGVQFWYQGRLITKLEHDLLTSEQILAENNKVR